MDFGKVLNVLDDDGNGFDLGDLANITKLDLNSLLSADFLKQFTKFGSIGDLLEKVGVSSPAALANVDLTKLNDVVKGNSSFGNWQDLLKAAQSFIKK